MQMQVRQPGEAPCLYAFRLRKGFSLSVPVVRQVLSFPLHLSIQGQFQQPN